LQTVTVAGQPSALAVNANANQVLVSAGGTTNLTVIDGVTNATFTIPVGGSASDVVVDPLTDRGFVAVTPLGIVAVDVRTQGTSVIPMSGAVDFGLVLEQGTHKIYSLDLTSESLIIVDGLTATAVSKMAGATPVHLAVNSATNTVYVSSRNSLVV